MCTIGLNTCFQSSGYKPNIAVAGSPVQSLKELEATAFSFSEVIIKAIMKILLSVQSQLVLSRKAQGTLSNVNPAQGTSTFIFSVGIARILNGIYLY